MYDIIVYADIIDGYSKYLDKSITSPYSNSSLSMAIDSENIHGQDAKDAKEFKTVYCTCFKFPWFKRKDLSVSASARSFQNKDLDLSMRMKLAFKNLVD